MKKLIIILVAVIVAASCQKDPVNDPTAGQDQRLTGTWEIDSIHIDGWYSYYDTLGNTPAPNYYGDVDSTLRNFRAEWVLSGDYDTIVTFTTDQGAHICGRKTWQILGSPWLSGMYYYAEGDDVYTDCDVMWMIEQHNSSAMVLYAPSLGRRFYLSK